MTLLTRLEEMFLLTILHLGEDASLTTIRDGLAALADTRQVHDAMWKGIPAARLKGFYSEK